MALNVTESNAWNHVMDALYGDGCDDDKLRKACEVLTRSSNKTLAAGWMVDSGGYFVSGRYRT